MSPRKGGIVKTKFGDRSTEDPRARTNDCSYERLFLIIFPLRMEVAIAQNTQPRQNPTATPPKPLDKTPTTPTGAEIRVGELSTIRASQPFHTTPTTPVTDADDIDSEQAEKVDKLSLKNEQNSQPRQTPTVTPPKPPDKTPTTPTNDEGQEEQILENY
jgi:hypothetical protein